MPKPKRRFILGCGLLLTVGCAVTSSGRIAYNRVIHSEEAAG